MIKEFNKKNLKQLRMEIDDALEKIKEFHGISIKLGNISYSDKEFSVKLNCAVLDENGNAKPDYVINWEAGNYVKHRMKEEDLGKAVRVDGEWYKVVGCSARACKRGIIVQHVESKKLYTMSHETINPHLYF